MKFSLRYDYNFFYSPHNFSFRAETLILVQFFFTLRVYRKKFTVIVRLCPGITGPQLESRLNLVKVSARRSKENTSAFIIHDYDAQSKWEGQTRFEAKRRRRPRTPPPPNIWWNIDDTRNVCWLRTCSPSLITFKGVATGHHNVSATRIRGLISK